MTTKVKPFNPVVEQIQQQPQQQQQQQQQQIGDFDVKSNTLKLYDLYANLQQMNSIVQPLPNKIELEKNILTAIKNNDINEFNNWRIRNRIA